MPIYMDRHDLPPGVNKEDVAAAHLEDLKFQDKHGCNCMTYWFDEDRSAAFCLFEAPDKKTVKDLHEESHGLVPNQIIEVDTNLVQAFLGRLGDPDSSDDSSQSAFRAIMFTDLKDSTSLTQTFGDKKSMELLRFHNNLIKEKLLHYEGRLIKNTGDGFMISFNSASKASQCAIALQRAFHEFNKGNSELRMNIRIGISAGEPVTESGDLFGSAIQFAARLCDEAEPNEILVSSVVSELCLGQKMTFHNKGELSLKGFGPQASIYQLEWQQ